MSLTRHQVEHIAELAKLDLTEAELTRYAEQLSTILDYFEALRAINTDDIPPTASVLPLRNILREDEVKPTLTRDQILANAPEKEEGQFRVKAVLD